MYSKGFYAVQKEYALKNTSNKIDFLIKILVENEPDKNNLTNIARDYIINDLKKSNYQPTDNQPFIKLPWIPIVDTKFRK